MYGTADESDLVETWRDELGPYEGSDIKTALETMRHAYKEFPPTLYQFSDLCRDALRRRTTATPMLARPKDGPIDPEIAAHIHALLDKTRTRDPKDWARRVLKRADEGTEPRPPLIAVEFAKEALGL